MSPAQRGPPALVPPLSGLQTWGLVGWAMGVLWLPPMKAATPLVLHQGDQVGLFPAPPRSRSLFGSGPSPGVGTPRSPGQERVGKKHPKGWASYSQAQSVHLRPRIQTRDDWQGCRLPRRQSRLSHPVGPGLRVSEANGRCCPGTGRWEPATLGFDKNTVLSVWEGRSSGENVTSQHS